MASAIDTLGKAVRHGITVRVTCPACGRVTDHSASDLMMKHGGGRNPWQMTFKCLTCAPRGVVTLIEPIDTKPKTNGRTIADMIAEGSLLGFYCYNSKCGHSEMLDLRALADRLGPDHGAMHDDLVKLISCPRCHGKHGHGHGFRYHQDSDRILRDSRARESKR